MSRGLGAGWPVVAFADLEREAWGVITGGPSPQLVLGALAESTPATFAPAQIAERIAVDGGADAPQWTVRGDAGTVRIAADEPPAGEEPDLCRVTGTIELDGVARELDCGGLWCAATPSGKLNAVRIIGAWFPAGHGVAIVAARPAGANGQDRDAISAVVSGESGAANVFDPRLSTTYAGDGTVRRVGIELWLGENADADLSSRRVAGEQAGSSATATVDGVRLSVYPLRCQSRGDDGAGVYVLLAPA